MELLREGYSDGLLSLSEGNVVLTEEGDHGLAEVGGRDVAVSGAERLELLAELLERGRIEDVGVLAVEVDPGLGGLQVELARASNGLVVAATTDIHAMGLEVGLALSTCTYEQIKYKRGSEGTGGHIKGH